MVLPKRAASMALWARVEAACCGGQGRRAGAAELHAYGAVDPALASMTADDRDLTRQKNRNAAVSGLGTGLGSAIAGLSLWGVLLLGVADLSAGTATLNGHDLASYAEDDVRTRIGGCPQDPYIFDASLRDNLRLAGRRPPTSNSTTRRPGPGCSPGSGRCHWDGTRRPARTGRPCPAGSASDWPWRAPCSPIPRC